MLTLAVSSRSLFHIEDGNRIFETEGQDAFDAYMREKENVPLRPGCAFHLVRKLLSLNQHPGKEGTRLVNVVMLSRNSPDASMRVSNSIAHYGLDIEGACFSQGSNRCAYARAMGADLFLSANAADVRAALSAGIAAATMVPREDLEVVEPDNEVRIAFDGDSVLFSDEADVTYRAHGLEAFRKSELENAHIPLGDGPFKGFLEALHSIQKEFPKGQCPLRVALVTARGLPSHGRVLHTLRHWGINVDEAIFAGGRPKGPLLQAFRADMFFDDTQKNIDSAVSHNVPSGHVPYGTGEGIVAASPPLKVA